MERQPDLPPEFDPLLAELADQPEYVREIFRYALVLMMVDDEKARNLGTNIEEGKEILRVQTIAGEEFRIVRPPMSEEPEQVLLEQVRRIVVEDGEA